MAKKIATKTKAKKTTRKPARKLAKATVKKSAAATNGKPASAKKNGSAKRSTAKKTPVAKIAANPAVETIGKRIAALRLKKSWSQVELAQKSGLSQGHICDLERERKRPSVITLQSIAKALGVTAGVLLGESSC